MGNEQENNDLVGVFRKDVELQQWFQQKFIDIERKVDGVGLRTRVTIVIVAVACLAIVFVAVWVNTAPEREMKKIFLDIQNERKILQNDRERNRQQRGRLREMENKIKADSISVEYARRRVDSIKAYCDSALYIIELHKRRRRR